MKLEHAMETAKVRTDDGEFEVALFRVAGFGKRLAAYPFVIIWVDTGTDELFRIDSASSESEAYELFASIE